MEDKKTFNDLYDLLIEISNIEDLCGRNIERDKKLARLLIKFRLEINGAITKELEKYIKEYPLINYIALTTEVLTDPSLSVDQKCELCKNFNSNCFKTDTVSKSMIRRLEIQRSKRDNVTIRKT